jgi:hypothetical protein
MELLRMLSVHQMCREIVQVLLLPLGQPLDDNLRKNTTSASGGRSFASNIVCSSV